MLSPISAEKDTQATTAKPQLVTLRVNGAEHTFAVEARRTLLDALRHDLRMTGTKKVCDMGNCGACTVLIDGRAIYSCLLLAIDCQDYEITTIEGLASHPSADEQAVQPELLDPIQQAFVDCDAFQCGFCTSGQIMSLKALLLETQMPSDEQILRAVTGNICRCGAYRNILAAGRKAADAQSQHDGEATSPHPTK